MSEFKGGMRPDVLKHFRDNIYTKLGVRPMINAKGTVTSLGGSIMAPEVIQAMIEASQYFVSMSDLHEKVGQRIAELIGVEAATVTTGAAGAITMATAACVTEGNPDKAYRLPETLGMKSEVIMQKSHRAYEAQMRLVGARIVEVETAEDLEAAVGPNTAMLFFLNVQDPKGHIGRKAWVAAGRRHRVPTFNDAAADVPPVERLSEYLAMGFDLVGFSGGKGLRGPQNTGLLLGRRDLVTCARAHGRLWGGIGRAMKVGKEEVAGLLAAVDRFVNLDHQAERELLESRVEMIERILSDVDGVRTVAHVPEIANHVPHLSVEWDVEKIGLSSHEVSRQLLKGNPAIAVGGYMPRSGFEEGPSLTGVTVSVWMLQSEEPEIVGQRLREILMQFS